MTPPSTFVKSSSNLLSNFKQSLIFILTQSNMLPTTTQGTVCTKPLRMCSFPTQLKLFSFKLATLIKLYKLLKNSRCIKVSPNTVVCRSSNPDQHPNCLLPKQLGCWTLTSPFSKALSMCDKLLSRYLASTSCFDIFSFDTFLKDWWRWQDSNPLPTACKAAALPAELHPQNQKDVGRQWWVWLVSNQRPLRYQHSALTNWATDPSRSLLTKLRRRVRSLSLATTFSNNR